MSGRNGLTWVTALTITSLLLGSGALNALAEGHGGGEHGGGSGPANAGHQQPTPTVTHAVNQGSHDGEGGSNPNHSTPAHTVLQSPAPAQVTHNDDNNGNHNADNNHGDNNNHDNNVDRKPDDGDDLVTKPARVTDDARPCRDDDHTCNNGNNNDDNGGDHGATNPDASAGTVADADAVDATDN